MIVVAGHMSIDPDQLDAAVTAIREGVAATRAETGNVDYRFSPDLDEPGRFNITEIWEDEDAMNSHLATDHLASFLTAIGPLIKGSVSVIRYDVSGSSTLF